MRTRIWHSDWKPRWLIRCVSAALLSFMDKQEDVYIGAALSGRHRMDRRELASRVTNRTELGHMGTLLTVDVLFEVIGESRLWGLGCLTSAPMGQIEMIA